MYPRLSDLFNDLFGTNIELPIQSYGFFLALAFITGAFVIYHELNRKEKEGLIQPQYRKVMVGKPASPIQLLINFMISLLIGYKIGGIVVDYGSFVTNPQDFVFSADGSWWIGIIIAAVHTGFYYQSKKKKELHPPVLEEITVHAKEQAMPILFLAVIGGIVGAKVFHWIENWDEFIRDPIGALVSFSGLTFYGGLIFGVLAGILYGQKNGISWRYLLDAASPSLILSYGIGRIGCQIAGDGDWGIVNLADKPNWLGLIPDWLWSYNYPHNILNEGIPIPGCAGPHCFQLSEAVFPTPVYETLMAFAIFLFLWSIRKRIKIPGLLFSIYLMFNGTERFLIEKIRVNNTFEFFGLTLTQAEIISSIIFMLGVITFVSIFIYHRKKEST